MLFDIIQIRLLSSPLGITVAIAWAIVAALALALARIISQESRKDRIICLLYHRVVPPEVYATFRQTERIFSIGSDRFAEQLDWLKAQGYNFVSLDQVVAYLEKGDALPSNPVYISFDDGCESVYSRALPILKERKIPATVFVTTDENAWIFHSSNEYNERRMTLEEIRACDEGGIAVESHAVTHRGLNEMSKNEVLEELTSSRALLTEWIGRQVDYFAVPLNFYNGTTIKLCKEAGYRGVCTSDNGTNARGSNPFRVKRFIVEGSYDIPDFERSLKPRTIAQRRIVSFIKKMPPKILGEKTWMPLRAKIFASPIGRWLTFRYLRRALLLGAASAMLILFAMTALVFGSGVGYGKNTTNSATEKGTTMLNSLPSLSVQELDEILKDGQTPYLLDVREESEFEIVSLPNAVLIPVSRIAQEGPEALPAELKDQEDIVVYCKMGGRSAQITGWLMQQGITQVRNLDGGIIAWAREIDTSLPTY